MKAMMQNELRQALAELMPPLAPAAAITPITNPSVVDALLANNNNVGGNL